MTEQRIQLQRADVKLDRSEDEGPRRWRMLAYTGASFSRMWGDAVIDIAGLEAPDSAPAYRQHDPSKFIGRVDTFDLEPGEVSLGGFLFDGVAAAEEVTTISRQGGKWQASLGIGFAWDDVEEVAEGDSVEVNGREFMGPISVIRKARIHESSFVPEGADAATTAEVLHKEATMAEQKKQPDPVAVERERLGTIRAHFGEQLKDNDFALEAIAAGWSLVEAKAEYSERLAARLEEHEAAAEKREAELAKRVAAAEEALAKPNPAALLGTPGNATLASQDADPKTRWALAVAAEVARLKEDGSQGARRAGGLALTRVANLKAQAAANVADADPELHRSYLDAVNAQPRRK